MSFSNRWSKPDLDDSLPGFFQWRVGALQRSMLREDARWTAEAFLPLVRDSLEERLNPPSFLRALRIWVCLVDHRESRLGCRFCDRIEKPARHTGTAPGTGLGRRISRNNHGRRTVRSGQRLGYNAIRDRERGDPSVERTAQGRFDGVQQDSLTQQFEHPIHVFVKRTVLLNKRQTSGGEGRNQCLGCRSGLEGLSKEESLKRVQDFNRNDILHILKDIPRFPGSNPPILT